ncbi:FG-GAP-like repeat-containing protein [Actinomadura oligospora]|uniref:FG-GAP-like repeat-containing protein n=1 Tax=Actinomadura oligospora TaxID=111804 RepID=UPI0004B6478B|nr:FG-GAP-like repeat-containing protein [Actinomadura oligospora]
MRRRTLAVVGSLAAGAVAAGSAVALTVGDTSHVSAAQVADTSARKPARPGDLNGDGRRDLILPNESAEDGSGHNGRVVIVPVGPRGPLTAQRDLVTRGRAGLPAQPDRKETFGEHEASADFDRDGYADLAVSTTSGDGKSTGVLVFYGGPKGLTGRHVLLPGPEVGAMAIGDFDGNGRPDLAVVELDAARADHYYHYRLYANVGSVAVKPTVTKINKLTAADIAGFRAVAADVNGDGKADLALTFTSLYERGGRGPAFGEVRYGTAKGLGAPHRFATGWTERSIAAGDINGDHRADLVVRRYTGKKPAQISVLYGGKTGLSKPVSFSKDTPGVPGKGSADDDFAHEAIAVGDLNGDGLGDVAVGAPRTPIGKLHETGAVTVLYGTRKGLTGKGARSINLSLPGAPDRPRTEDYFGGAVVIQDLNGDGRPDLVVGAGNHPAPKPVYRGAIFAFPGGKGGPLLKGSTWITPQTLNVKEEIQLGERIMP